MSFFEPIASDRVTRLPKPVEFKPITLPRNHPTLPDDHAVIRIHLDTWSTVFEESIISPGAQRKRWQKILKFFLKVGTLNNLKATPALTFLENSLAIIENSKVNDSESLDVDENIKICQQYNPVKVTGIVRSKNLIFNSIPLHNVWDAISFVYTVSVEKIRTRRQAEAHTYQFRTIIKTLRAGEKKIQHVSHTFSPTTTEAAWDSSFLIAFGTTCVGEASNKKKMSESRREFMDTIPDVKGTEKGWIKKYHRNYEGNCPEYLSWPTICQARGSYETLCLNMGGEGEEMAMAYECCDYCTEMAGRLKKTGRIIDDLWQKSSLVDHSRKIRARPRKSASYTGAYLKPRGMILSEYKSQ